MDALGKRNALIYQSKGIVLLDWVDDTKQGNAIQSDEDV
jgi:hypothetical protein